jgi:uncharacterized protein (DUF58 family)
VASTDQGDHAGDGRAAQGATLPGQEAGKPKLARGRRYIDESKDTQFSSAWIALGLILTIGGLLLNSSFLLAAALSLFSVSAVAWIWNRLALVGVEYRRQFGEIRAFQGESVELTLEVRNRKPLPITWLQVIDVFPAGLPVDDQQIATNRATNQGEFTSFWSLGAFGRVTRRFTVACTQRGFHNYGPASVSTGDAFGMFSSGGVLSNNQRLIVYPRIYAASELGLPAKNPFGDRLAETPLVEDPLRTAGVRDWQPGDGMRRVHWKATARHQALLSRFYEPSQETQVMLFLNVATMERHWLGHFPELMELTISVAASLAVLCAEMRLPVGLIANGFLPGSDQPLRLLPGRSPEQIVHIMELLAAVTAFATEPIEELLMREARRLPWGATILVVTAIAHDGLMASLAELRHAGRKVVLFTLAERPPEHQMPGMLVYHLPHLVDDLVAPQVIAGGGLSAAF